MLPSLLRSSCLHLGAFGGVSIALIALAQFLGRRTGRVEVARTIELRALKRLQTFIGNAPVAIAMLDANMRYVSASRRWISDYGLDAHSLIGRSHYEIFPEIPDRWRAVHARCLAGATEKSEEDCFTRADGSQQWVRWEIRPWRIWHKPRVENGIIIFAEDITERKKAEDKARELFAQQLRTEAEAINRAKDEFVALLSHELRGPLHSMLGWVQIAKRSESDADRLAQALAAIERNARLQASIISDILDINRISAGKVQLDLQEVFAADLLANAVEACIPQAQEKGVLLQMDAPVPTAAVRGDRGRLHQCLTNLISNAIKFSPSGGSVLVAGAASGGELELVVRDTGIGLKADQLESIFGRFVQADTALQRNQGGLGLGLFIVRSLVELHGGRVLARSMGEGQGSEFTVWLPCKVIVPEARSAREAEPITEEAPRPLAGQVVAVVDDQAEARHLCRVALEDLGARVEEACSAEELFKLMKGAAPSLLVCDISMPRYSGYQLISNLRSAGWSLPAIALTAHAGEQHVAQAIRAGFTLHLAKPVEAAELKRAALGLLKPALPDPLAS